MKHSKNYAGNNVTADCLNVGVYEQKQKQQMKTTIKQAPKAHFRLESN